MKPSSQGSRSARSSECAAGAGGAGPAAGSEAAAPVEAVINKQNNREMEKCGGCGRNIFYPLEATQAKRHVYTKRNFPQYGSIGNLLPIRIVSRPHRPPGRAWRLKDAPQPPL